MLEGSQLLINTEAFVISEREGQGVGGELVREIGPFCHFCVSARSGRAAARVGGVLAWKNIRRTVLLRSPTLARSHTYTTHTLDDLA
jgi:hypothetical protein